MPPTSPSPPAASARPTATDFLEGCAENGSVRTSPGKIRLASSAPPGVLTFTIRPEAVCLEHDENSFHRSHHFSGLPGYAGQLRPRNPRSGPTGRLSSARPARGRRRGHDHAPRRVAVCFGGIMKAISPQVKVTSHASTSRLRISSTSPSYEESRPGVGDGSRPRTLKPVT